MIQILDEAETPQVQPNGKKSLPQLRQEWESCTKCSLGVARVERDGSFVFGEGVRGKIMFIGSGPGEDEEKEGGFFAGPNADFFKKVLKALGLSEGYVTHVVACRACELALDQDGQPRVRKDWQSKKPSFVYRDVPPLPAQVAACLPRLYEEIYLVDPVIIVGMGGKVCEALMGHPVTLTRDRGKPVQIEVPGASWNAKLTDKKQEWLRKRAGTLVAPVEQNFVRYLFMPTYEAGYVSRYLSDQGHDSAFKLFVSDLRAAIRTYEAYNEHLLGIVSPTKPSQEKDESSEEAEFYDAMQQEES